MTILFVISTLNNELKKMQVSKIHLKKKVITAQAVRDRIQILLLILSKFK